MTTVLLIGIQDQEANQLESEFARLNHDVSIVRLPEVGIPRGIDVTRSVAVLSGMAEEGLLERIEAAVELSLAVIVLMPKFVIRDDIDVSRGHIDFCFAPYRAEELSARIGLLVNRSRDDTGHVVQQGEIRIDLDRYEVTVSGRKVDLTFKEYELLRVLASNPGHVYSRDVLLETVWAYDYYGGTRTVDVHIRRLRSKINDVEHQFIETVWNVGYRFRIPEA